MISRTAEMRVDEVIKLMDSRELLKSQEYRFPPPFVKTMRAKV